MALIVVFFSVLNSNLSFEILLKTEFHGHFNNKKRPRLILLLKF